MKSVIKKQMIRNYMPGIILLLNFVFSFPGYSQEYKLKPEDALKITFLEQPELNRETKVGLDGNISLPVIGDIKAAGLTTSELIQKIISEFSIYAVSITQASVEIMTYESNKIYITGHVTNPGKYIFEKIPNLWKVISEAGGPTDNANLSNVLIVRSADPGGTTLTVNLTEILQSGDLSQLPELKPGDNIHVPGVIGQTGGRGVESLQQQRHVIYIYGEIGTAGIYTFDESVNLLQAIITAGGPTANARLNDVRIIRRGQKYFSQVVKLNINWYVEEARHDFFKLLPGDIVYIPKKKLFRETLSGTLLISVVLPVTLTALIYEIISRNR